MKGEANKHVEVGDHVLEVTTGLMHVVGLSTYHEWDALCESIYDNYQPDYYAGLDIDEQPAGTIWWGREGVVTCVRCLVMDMLK